MTTRTEIREKPILFSGEMVRAILAGKKTQTRRVIRHVFKSKLGDGQEHECIKDWDGGPSRLDWAPFDWEICPYGVPGDRLWVQETFYFDLLPWANGGSLRDVPKDERIADHLYYRVDGTCCEQIPECACAEIGKPKWRSARFTPRWVSRINLEITQVRVQRLQQITSADCVAEGQRPTMRNETPARERFRRLWNELNAKRGFGWDVNPWVWVISFKRAETST